MEVRESEWKKKAIENITQYVNRGGQGQGDVPQLIGGSDLLNTIGVAMGLPTSDPDRWTPRQLEMALQGRLVFYKGEARKAIDAVADQIRYCCGGDDRNFVTVLPLELYFEGKLFELPLFRVKRKAKSENYYIDNVGRCYASPADWDSNNKLPPGEVAYPTGMKLSLTAGGRALVSCVATPVARPAARVARGVDALGAVAGLGSGVALLFVSGGLATPLVVTAVSAAAWGTGRAGCQLADRATHGESVDPFSSTESRMLWLGIAANLTSFGAMGATMRLTSLAARGRDISGALRLLADVANGANLTVSGLAILNSTAYMIVHREELSAVDVLVQGASIAFWTKGVFCYKTANMIIKDAQNYAFATITKELSREEASQFDAVRNRFRNDAQLLQNFQAAAQANIPLKEYSQLLIDGMHYYDTVATLTPEQISAFDGLRLHLRDDVKLISGLRRVSANYNLNPSETVELVAKMWQQMGTSAKSDGGSVVLRGGSLVLGRAPPIRIEQLPQLSAPMIQFIGEHLSRVDATVGGHWATAVPVLLELQGHGMFTVCPVSRVVSAGRAVVSLNGHLEISIYRLHAMTADDRVDLFRALGRLPPDAPSAALPDELLRCVRRHRLRLQCQRRESVRSVARGAAGQPALLELLRGELHSHEQDRLYTFLQDAEVCKANLYMNEMLAFVADLRPSNISEMVAYSEFVMTYVEDLALALKGQIRNGELPMPDRVKISVWTRNTAIETVFRDTGPLTRRLADVLAIVRENRMVGRAAVGAGLSAARLEAAVRGARLAYGGEVSAAYHVLKHPTQPLGAHVERANATLRNPGARVEAALGQAGDVRTLLVEDERGKCVVLERDGSVILCSFTPK